MLPVLCLPRHAEDNTCHIDVQVDIINKVTPLVL